MDMKVNQRYKNVVHFLIPLVENETVMTNFQVAVIFRHHCVKDSRNSVAGHHSE